MNAATKFRITVKGEEKAIVSTAAAAQQWLQAQVREGHLSQTHFDQCAVMVQIHHRGFWEDYARPELIDGRVI